MDYETGKSSLSVLIRDVEEFRKLQLEITLKIRELSASERYSEDYGIISSIPGIAVITGMTFLTEIEDINRFSDTDHFAAFVGLIPKCHSSGEKQANGEITFRRHFLLRTMLVESAWTAAGKDPALHLSFVKLCKRMEQNKAIIRIARKLLNRIYYMLKRKEKYVCGTVNQKLSNT
jgi:transposase